MNVSCKRSFWGKLLSTTAVVLALFMFSGLTSELHAQQDQAAAINASIDFVSAGEAEAILATFLADLNTQIANGNERDANYATLVAQQNFVLHVWEDVSLGTPVATALSNRYSLISKQASGTATATSKYQTPTNAAQSFNPAYVQVVNLLKK